MTPPRSVLGWALAGTLAVVGLGHAAAPQQAIQGPTVEQFLTRATIAGMKDIGKGVTHPRKATLELDGVTGSAVFKDIDEKPIIGATPVAGGVEPEFQDSWRTEVAAYELDKLIGLGMVPATVERVYERKSGSMQLWAESVMDSATRQKNKVDPPDPSSWNDQMDKLFLWDDLIYNTDRNLSNILITAQWRIVAIDHSRTFRPFSQLKDAKALTRFSRSLLAKIGALNQSVLKARLDKYLTSFQIDGILKRRDTIVALAKKLVEQKGEAAVLYQ